MHGLLAAAALLVQNFL